jgi:hypothetical protein
MPTRGNVVGVQIQQEYLGYVYGDSTPGRSASEVDAR